VSLPHPRTGAAFCSPVPPGSGWPGDPATARTPVAGDAAQVAACATAITGIGDLDAHVSVCRACPRLVEWREDVAAVKRRAFAEQPYWGRPAPGWGSPHPRILVLGLAPAAHGANRTGRVFTGVRSGDQVFAALHRAVAFRRFRAADVRSILAAGAGTPQPRAAGDALILDLPVAPTRSLDAYKITAVADSEVIS
jgi:hypothetical protein